jgi:hypothetical protein
MDRQDEIKRICLQLMAPTVEEFAKTIAEMREQGASDADIATMLDMVESNNRGTVEDEILEVMMSELRRVAATTAPKTIEGSL